VTANEKGQGSAAAKAQEVNANVNEGVDTPNQGQLQAQSRAAQLAEDAQKYHDNHHWVSLRLEGKSPNCMGAGWNKRTLKNPIPKFKDGDNILLGEPSGNLVRLDPDYPALPGVMDILWPEPTLGYGRKSSPRSGRLIRSKLKSKDFNLPSSVEADPRTPRGDDGKPSLKVYQVLSTGKQTMVPPSVHPSGELVVWHNNAVAPVELEPKEVMRRAGLEAFLMAVTHYWPARGTRNEATWSLARVLIEALGDRYPDEDKLIATVDALLEEVAASGGDGEESLDGKKRARKTLEKMQAGEHTTGMPHLVELLGLPEPEKVVKTFRLWLRMASSDYVERMNQRHAVVRIGAKVGILDEQPGQPPQFMSTEDLNLWYANDRVRIGEESIPVSRLWLKHAQRRQYQRVVFDPMDSDPNHFNMWRGFAVKPDPTKSCEKFLAHIRDNICTGNAAHYQWVLGFLAHMVQKPHEKPGVALVLRGDEGVGKGFLAYWLGQLCPQHYVAVSQSVHITGRFNAHLQQALLVFVDEAFWAGDKQGQGTLYRMITDQDMLIETKFQTPFLVKSMHRFIIASNANWVVPAGVNARRWCVLDVASTHIRDRVYFGAIDNEMKNGGLEALMHTLLNFDLSTVDIYNPPKTAALLEQKIESLQPHERWWFECLQEGRIENPSDDFCGRDKGWPSDTEKGDIEKDAIWQSYKNWTEQHNVRGRVWPDKQLHKWLKDNKLIPGSRVYKPFRQKRLMILPSLVKCRDALAAHLGQPIEWAEEDAPAVEAPSLAPGGEPE
jgi:Family of unknown function (DUF5906)